MIFEFKFYCENKIEIEFGKVVRGIRYKTERPSMCYISPEELEKHAYYIHNLAAYLHTVQKALIHGGQVVIR